MSGDTDPDHAASVDRLMERLSGFAQGIGISGIEAREIIKRVIASDPSAGDGDLMAKARTWMLIALG
ncbi:hypothetical protein [Methylobacterium sp. 285MFTsu5.1]|uniref:hypothetical protein n=1 Tax=Methylobacterium sp. 285MFTsu5.1 TaxID=1172187 RepID=UPI00035EFF7B|nr:hypothetical protein [Methylobacterium sp. 285MFTsu5.1]